MQDFRVYGLSIQRSESRDLRAQDSRVQASSSMRFFADTLRNSTLIRLIALHTPKP